jgi:threonylcarbamoyladenosine tRNA methylthiotransferase MtaB
VTAVLKTVTLGCKVNQYETQLVREGLLGIGFCDAHNDAPADLCVVNTCTVTSEGDAKSRQVIRRLHRQNPAARIMVMGCYATRAESEIRRLPGVSDVITDKRELPDWLARFGVIDVPRSVRGLHGRSRAYVKLQDGCLLRCSYCIIPQVRPHMYSRPPADIIAEIRQLIAGGLREVVLTGIHLGHYGVDFNRGRPRAEWVRLAGLLRSLVQLPGTFRIRLSSIEATEVSRELIAVMRDHPQRICPHLHVCLQSGSDRVLRRMKRRWGVKRFVDRCRLVQSELDTPALTTDVIVGFPGESDEDFAQSMEVCRTLGFSKIHIFPFSPRRGTEAANFPDQVPAAIRQERAAAMEAIESELHAKYVCRLLGRRVEVLVESTDRGIAKGTACRYAAVELPAEGITVGSLVAAIPTRVERGRLVAQPIFCGADAADG